MVAVSWPKDASLRACACCKRWERFSMKATVVIGSRAAKRISNSGREAVAGMRSEERRVGKECRSRGEADAERKGEEKAAPSDVRDRYGGEEGKARRGGKSDTQKG